MAISFSRRTRCELAQTEDLEPLAVFKDFPVFMGCTHGPASDDVLSDMCWSISRSSGLIQLDQLLPLELLYPEAHGSGAVGGIWRRHHQEFASFVHAFAPTAVLEIGGSHGVLALEYQQLQDIVWHIVEPNPMPVAGCRATFTKGFFSRQTPLPCSFDMVTHSHVLEHIYHPLAFFEDVSKVLAVGGMLCFTLPHMEVMLERKYSNCLNFEHTLYLTEPYLEMLLARHGFELVRKAYFMEDHSIFYAARKTGAARAYTLPAGLYQKNKKTFDDYVQYFRQLVTNLNHRLAACDAPVYIFGAHVFTQYLVAFGLATGKIRGVLDNDAAKWGKRLSGTRLIVESPRALAGIIQARVILKVGAYAQEIKADIFENINRDVVYWE